MCPTHKGTGEDRLLSTGKAAQLLSVTPDAVLKWIKSGRLPAIRTVGGHYRVDPDDLDRLVQSIPGPRSDTTNGFFYCWEYYANDGVTGKECLDCLVYRAKARRCFEMSDLPSEAGFSGTYCKTSCDECDYYQEMMLHSINVLIVTKSADLRRRLSADASTSRFVLQFAGSEYECSAELDDFSPEYVVIDGSLPDETRASLCSHLAGDPRIPGVRIVLAVQNPCSSAANTGRHVNGALPQVFSLADLEEHITGRGVKPAPTA
jgi:excisionase family DNA binding protein